MDSACHPNETYSIYTNGKIQPGLLYDLGTRILVSIIIPTVVSIGLIVNATFLFAVYRIRSMRNITNLYLVNLAVADLVFLIVAGGKSIYQYLYSPYMDDVSSLGVAGCSIITSIIYTSYFASIAIITLVSLERFYAITQPLRHRLFNSRLRVAKLLITSWFISLVLAGLVTLGFSSFQRYCLSIPETGPYSGLPEVVGYCGPLGTWAKYLETCVQAFPFFLAFIGNFYLYIRIIRCLNSRFDNLDVASDQNDRGQSQTQANATRIRNAIARMLIANGVIFFVCQFLARVVMLNQLMTELANVSIIPQHVHYVLMILSRILLFVNASINPVVYNVTNARYRKATKQAFMCHQVEEGKRYTGPSNRMSTGISEETQAFTNGVNGVNDDDIDTEV